MDNNTWDFLLLVLSSRWDSGALDEARALAARGAVAWDALAELAQAKVVAGLLYAQLRGKEICPPAVEAELREWYFSNARRNVLLFREVENVLRALDGAGIPVIVLKGAALAEAIYRNPAVRPMADVDLLVRQADMEAALPLLYALDYADSHPEPRAGDLLAYENEVMLVKGETHLELHWSLFDSPFHQRHLPMPWFWESARSVRIGDTPARMLGPEALLLHLCGHIVLHHGHGGEPPLLWLYDVAAVLAHDAETLHWPTLLAQAQSCHLVLPLQETLRHVQARWSLPSLEGWGEQVQALRPRPIERQVFQALTSPQRAVLRRFWTDLRYQPTWRERLRFGWHNVFPSTGYMRERYALSSGWLLPFSYPYRWFKGLWELLSR